jgi:hypothetical protein
MPLRVSTPEMTEHGTRLANISLNPYPIWRAQRRNATIGFWLLWFDHLPILNNHNEEAGYWQNAAGIQFPFYLGGVFTPLDPLIPSNTSAQATGVNNSGDVSGFYVDSAGINRGFFLQKGVLTILDFPGRPLPQTPSLLKKIQETNP